MTKEEKQKTGHWILTDVEYNRVYHCNCSECGCTVDYTDNDTVYRSEEEAIANVAKAWNKRKRMTGELKES